MADQLTNQRFGLFALGIAREAQEWAHGTFSFHVNATGLTTPMRPADALRFVAKIKERLAWIEEEANAAPAPTPKDTP